jgi:hypothetical protein
VTRISLDVFASAQFCTNLEGSPVISLDFLMGECVKQPESNRFMIFPSCSSAALSCADASCMSDCSILSWPFVEEALSDSQCKPWNPRNSSVNADESSFVMTCVSPHA